MRRSGALLRLGGSRQQRALLALLLLRPNQTLSIDRLIAELWGSDAPETAPKMIRNNVWRLRRLLEADDVDELLVTHPGGYELRIEPDRLDATVFERLVGEARKALVGGEPEPAAATLREALALWRGPALADLLDEPFVATERARLEELRLAAIEDRVEADLVLGRHGDVVGELEALAAEYPLRERLRSHLMLALYRSGRHAEALDVYQRTRQLLVDELGLEPSRELQRLERAILVQDPALDLDRPADTVARPAAAGAEAPAREIRKTVTVVVAEVVVLGSRRDPEALRRPVARSLDAASRVLERHGATVDRLATGGVTGVFGIPVVHEDDPVRAVRAASELDDAVAGANAELEQEWGIRVAVRAAVDTGEVIVGTGSAGHEVVAGDAVERAARLQQAAAAGEILIGEPTKRFVEQSVRVEAVDVDGAPDPLHAWRLLEVEAQAPAIARHLETPMVGRARELAHLREAFERVVLKRTPYLVTVIGPAGIGKTRLAAEFAASVEDQAVVLTGRCPPYGEAITFWPLGEIVRQLTGDAVEPELADLAAGDPDRELIAQRVASAIGASDRPIPGEEAFWAFRRLFEAHARERPLVLVFDDVHWAEPTLLDLIEHVAARAHDAPILLVCLARSELLETRPSWGGGRPNAESIVLGPLSERESAQLVESIVRATGLRASTPARITEVAEGNPLFLEQMLAMLGDEATDATEVVVPPTIQAVLAARLDRLPPAERAVLECASVIGREFQRAAVAELSPDGTGGGLDSRLDGLVRRELIRPHRSLFRGDEAFRFRHTLLREAAYESVPKEARAELHERYAAWLEQAAGTRAREFEEHVGHHLERAYRYRVELAPVDEQARALARQAVDRLAPAGRRAYARGDLPAAVNLLSRAAALVEPHAERADLLVDLGDALRESGDLARAESVLAEAVDDAAASGDAALEAHVAIARLRLQLQRDPDIETDEVLAAAGRAVGVFESLGDDRRLAKAWELLAWVPWFRCRAAAAEAALLRALEHARRAGDGRAEAQSLNLLVGAAWLGPLPVADGIARCEEMLAQPSQQRRVRASVLRALAGLKAMQGRFDEARRAMSECRAILDDLGLRVTAASAAETYAVVDLLSGDPVAAERELRAGYESLEQMGETFLIPVLAALLAQALYAQGRDEEALRFTELSERAAAPDDISAHVQWRAARAKALARTGALEEGEALAREAVAQAEQTDFLVLRADAVADLAEVLRAAGRAGDAARALAEAHELYERKGHVVSAARTRALLASEEGAASVS